jgi:SAM-dependent methyltransferase
MNDINWEDPKIKFFCKYSKNKNVLDLGIVQHDYHKIDFSTWLHRAIKSVSKSCIGVDIDREGLKELEARNFDVLYGDVQKLNLKKKFQVITAGDLIEHLDNGGLFLSSVKRHMKKDSLFILSTPNPFWWKTFLHVLFRGHSSPHPEHTCWFDEATLKQFLERNGFSIIEFDYGTVYSLTTAIQHITRAINLVLPLPKRFRHNTMLIACKINDHTN